MTDNHNDDDDKTPETSLQDLPKRMNSQEETEKSQEAISEQGEIPEPKSAAAAETTARQRRKISFLVPNDNEHTPKSGTNAKHRRTSVMPDAVRLATSQKHVKRAVLAVLFAVFTDAINLQCTAPNYPLMVTIGGHPDSFPNTDPFDTTAAQYLIVTASAGGAFIANLFAGYLSDKIGRRKMILINLASSVVFTLAKYFARHAYWTFTAMTFINGLCASTLAVSLGYVAEIFINDRSSSDAYMGHVVAIMVIGRSLGGLLTVLFPNDLFTSLLPATAITFLGFVVAFKFVLEPRGIGESLGKSFRKLPGKEAEDDDEEDANVPKQMDKWTVFNIVFGATADNAGSLGVIPLALAPLMFDTFHGNFVQEGLEPIMSEQAYRWLYSMVATAVVPGALASPFVYKKFGPALSCVLANLLTAGVILALLYISLVENPTTGTFALFSTILYVSFPITVISQLSTGPMLDRVTPRNKKGFVQGLNGAASDGTSAVFPFIYGLLADTRGTRVTYWFAAGISVFAALANMPLVFHPRLSKPQGKQLDSDGQDDDATVDLVLDEEEIQAKLEKGDFVPTKHIWTINAKRVEEGKPLLYTHPGEYTRGNYDLPKEEYRYLRDIAEQRVLIVRDDPQHKKAVVGAIQAVCQLDKEKADMTQTELGMWFKDYLADNGYFAGESSPILKAMFQKSFPRLSDYVVTEASVEQRLIRIARLMNDYMEREGLENDGTGTMFGEIMAKAGKTN